MAAGIHPTLEFTPPARAPTPPHTSGVHARAKRPNLGPTRHTRGLPPAARLVIPLESTGARRRRTISCDRAAIRTAGPAMWWITSCRSPVVVPMRPATCSGKRPRTGRQRIGWSDAGAAPGIERPLSHPQLIFSKSLTQPESVMDDVPYSSTAGLPLRWLEPLRIAAHDLTQRLLEASAALSTSGAGEGLERRGPAPGRRGPRGRRAARLTREPSLPTGIDPPTPQFRPQDIDRSRLCAILTRC